MHSLRVSISKVTSLRDSATAMMRILGASALLVFACAITAHGGNDRSTAIAVQRVLEADARVPHAAISVHTAEGTVYLTGIVSSFREKQRAEQLARSVPGVRTVVNNVLIVPPAVDVAPSPFDEWARQEAL